MIIEGNISVKAALENNKREIEEVIVNKDKDDRDTSYILRLAKERNIKITKTSREEIDAVASGKTHGGLIAKVTNRNYESLEDILEIDKPFITLVEGVEDPFNLGYILRTLYSSGSDALILKERSWGDSESVILKSSAGAFEHMNIIMSNDIARDINKIKENGIKTVCANRKDAKVYTEADLSRPLLLALGGEMRGLSRDVLNLMDESIYIPYKNDFKPALNAASAMAVLAFEVFNQNSK